MAKYVHDDNNNRIEALSKEEIYALIDEVIESGELPSDVPPAFVTALKSIVDGKAYKIGFCTQYEYNQIEARGGLVADALYIITDDETEQDLEAAIDALSARITANGNFITALDNRITVLEEKHLYRHSLYLSAYVTLSNPSTGADIKVYLEVTTTTNNEIKTFADLAAVAGGSLIANGYVRGTSLGGVAFISPIVHVYAGTASIGIHYLYDNNHYDYSYVSSAEVFTDTIKQIY